MAVDDDFFSIVSSKQRGRPTELAQQAILPVDKTVAKSLGWDRHDGPTEDAFYSNFHPTLWTVSEYAGNIYNAEAGEHRPLIGERETFLTGVIIYICAELGIIIRSYPGTGKTVTADAIYDLIPEEFKHRVLNLSGKGIWYSSETINSRRYIYFGEWQKAAQNEDVVEIVKDWGEGRTAERSRSDITTSQQTGVDSVKTTRMPRKPMLVTVASADGKDDESLNEQVLRRYPEVATDPSRMQTIRVIKFKGKLWDPGSAGVYTMTDEEKDKLRQHIRFVIETAEKDAILPGGEYVLLKTVPPEYPISRSVTDIFKKMVNGIARFHHYDRLRWEDSKGKLYIVATPADFWIANRIYGKSMMLNCLRITNVGREILECMPRLTQRGTTGGLVATANDKLNVKEIRRALQQRGISLEKGKVQYELGMLVGNTYLDEDDGTPKRYWRSDTTTKMDQHLSPELMRDIVENMKREAAKYPFAAEYISRFCTGPINVVDPLTGQTLDILSESPDIVVSTPSNVSVTPAEEEEIVVQAEEPRKEEPSSKNSARVQDSLYSF